MKKQIWIIAGFVVFSLFLQGCQNKQTGEIKNGAVAKSDKMAQLVFVENEQLKTELAESQNSMAKCEDEKQALIAKNAQLQQTIDKNLQEMIEEMLGMVMEEQAKLQQENKQLKEQLAAMKGVTPDVNSPQ